MKYVIVGNGVASIGAIEGIRKVDRDGQILVISEEDSPTYGRPLISYYLAGKIDLDRLPLRDDKYYADLKVELKLSTKVASLDPSAKVLTTTAGETISYDKLLLATGGTPFVPPLEGVDGPDIYKFTTLAHAKALDSIAKKLKKAVVIGGGLIGLKAAEALHDRGVHVTIVELAPRVLSAAFDDNAGRLVSDRLEKTGLRIVCGAMASAIKRGEDGRVRGVLLKDGRFVEGQAVVVAIGVMPNSGLAKEAGLGVERGVTVDSRLATSNPDIYAAGDVVQAFDLLWGEKRVTPIWPNAYSQGYTAGRNMAGQEVEYAGGLAMNAISFYGLPTTSVGIVNPPEGDSSYEVSAYLDEDREIYRKLVFRQDRLVGYVLVGDIDRSGDFTGFIKFQIPLDAEAREKLSKGEPSALLWPAEYFCRSWGRTEDAAR